MTDYIKREDAARAMAQYMMDTALIGNPEASDRIEEWEGNIAAPVMSTVKAADVVKIVRCENCKYWYRYIRYLDHNICDFWSTDSSLLTKHDDYCSFGERAENE